MKKESLSYGKTSVKISIRICVLLFLSFFISVLAHANEMVETEVDGHKIKVLKIVKNTGYKVIVGVSEKGESLDSMVKRYGGVSGVNGAYFCPADYKKQCPNGNKSYADRISNGTSYSLTPDDTGPERVIFALDKDQNPFLFRKAHDYSRGRDDEFLQGKTLNFDKKKEIFNGIGNHPLLLQDGISKIGESKAIDEKMKARGLKNFICSNKEGNVILMGGVENVTIYELPSVINHYGCHNAIGLDSGGSSAMMHNNKYVRGPGRDIMDAFIIIPDKNYPVKPDFTKDPKTQRAIEDFKNMLSDKFVNLDDMTRKQKLFALSSKLETIIAKLEKGSRERVFYEGIKKFVDMQIQ